MISQSGIIASPQRSVIVRNEVVGQKLRKVNIAELGSANTIDDRKNGKVNNRFRMPAICWPCWRSVTTPPIAAIIAPINAKEGKKNSTKRIRISSGNFTPWISGKIRKATTQVVSKDTSHNVNWVNATQINQSDFPHINCHGDMDVIMISMVRFSFSSVTDWRKYPDAPITEKIKNIATMNGKIIAIIPNSLSNFLFPSAE